MGKVPRKQYGRTEPRKWTKPLRPLTPETSLGFEVIDFALQVLGIELWPWQRWLLIHALELREDGTYRFRRVIVLVGRQNGKTTLASVLAAWWLFVDSARRPDRVPPIKFKVVGVAQTLDIAREPWAFVKVWSDPKPETSEDEELALPALQAATAKVVDTNGKESIIARSRAHYEIRAAKNARGKPAARIILDELREQRDWVGWNAVSQTTKNFWNGQLWGLSNAGDMSSVVLIKQRLAALSDIADWEQYVESGLQTAEEFANGRDMSLGLFEWSGPDKDPIITKGSADKPCAKDDVDAILQANPSIGYGAMTVEICLADIRGMTDAGYRTEVLCQWVSAQVDSHIDVKDWMPLHVPPKSLMIPSGARTVWGVDTSADRSMTWVAGAVFTEEGRPFVTVRWKRAGMLWLPDFMKDLAAESGQKEVALQGKGCPAMEFVEPLTERGLQVHSLEGAVFALATGRIYDRVKDGQLVIIEQPDIDVAVQGGVVTTYAENLAWSRQKSLPIDISGLIAETCALYGLEVLEPPKRFIPSPPPQAELVSRTDIAPSDVNLATAPF